MGLAKRCAYRKILLVMKDPNLFDAIFGFILTVSFFLFTTFAALAKFCVDFRAAAELQERGKFRRQYYVFPPQSILKVDWRWVGAVRDWSFGTLGVILVLTLLRYVLGG